MVRDPTGRSRMQPQGQVVRGHPHLTEWASSDSSMARHDRPSIGNESICLWHLGRAFPFWWAEGGRRDGGSAADAPVGRSLRRWTWASI